MVLARNIHVTRKGDVKDILTACTGMSSFCVPLALPVYADVSPNRDKPLSKPDNTGRASGTQLRRDNDQ